MLANGIWQLSGQLLPLIAAGVSIPYIHVHLSAAGFGIFTIALSALGLFSVLDLGLGRATVRYATKALAEQDDAAAASVLGQSVLFLMVVSLTLGWLLFEFAPYITSHWIRSALREHEVVGICLKLLAIAVPIGALTSALRSMLEAREEFLAIGLIQSCMGTLTYVVPLGLALLRFGITGIVAAMVGCRLLVMVAYMIKVIFGWSGGFPWKGLSLKGHDEFRQFSFWTIASNLVGSAIVYGDRALLVRMFGLEEIPFYNIPLEMLGRLMILVNSFVTAMFPFLTRIASNRSFYERVYVVVMALVGALMGLVLLFASVMAPHALQYWLGASFRVHSTPTVRLFLVGLEFQCLNVMALASLNARGLARPIAMMHLLEAPIYFGGLYVAGARFGIAGLALMWSVRIAVEFAFFTLFQIKLLAGSGCRRQIVSASLAASNALPLMLVIVWDHAWAIFVTSGVTVLAFVFWAQSELRDAMRLMNAAASGAA